MKALVFHKAELRTVGGPVLHLLHCQIRSFVCFNGFNTAGAFTTNPGGEGDFTIVVGESAGFGAADSIGRMSFNLAQVQIMRSFPGSVITPLRCVGIGWIHEHSDQSYEAMVSNPHLNRWAEGAILGNETGFPRYYDGDADRRYNTKRDRTPNEIFIGRALMPLYEQQVSLPEHLRSSHVLRTLHFGNKRNGMDMDFVGSERPSGLAVAYLQVFRNASRKFTASTSSPEARMFSEIQKISGVTSVIPLLSRVCHGGGDSDILSFTGRDGAMAAQGVKHGVFTLSEFFGNSASMLSEGRYNKGEQSSSLGIKLHRAATRHNWPDSMAASWQGELENLHGIITSKVGLQSVLSVERIDYRGEAAWRRDLDVALSTYQRNGTVRELCARLQGLCGPDAIDLRAPVIPQPPPVDTSRIQGASTGFMQWITSNDGRLGNTTTRLQTPGDIRRLAELTGGVPAA